MLFLLGQVDASKYVAGAADDHDHDDDGDDGAGAGARFAGARFADFDASSDDCDDDGNGVAVVDGDDYDCDHGCDHHVWFDSNLDGWPICPGFYSTPMIPLLQQHSPLPKSAGPTGPTAS